MNSFEGFAVPLVALVAIVGAYDMKHPHLLQSAQDLFIGLAELAAFGFGIWIGAPLLWKGLAYIWKKLQEARAWWRSAKYALAALPVVETQLRESEWQRGHLNSEVRSLESEIQRTRRQILELQTKLKKFEQEENKKKRVQNAVLEVLGIDVSDKGAEL